VKALVEVPGVNKRSGSRGGGVNGEGEFFFARLKKPLFCLFPFPVSWARAHTQKRGSAYGSGYPLISHRPSATRRAGKKMKTEKGGLLERDRRG
jgi:hypothetical protein